ncbi:MAG: beta-galactosidase [Patescibacteria group bacterium]
MRFILHRALMVVCVFLAVFSVLTIPMRAETKTTDGRFGINSFVFNRYEWQKWDQPTSEIQELGVSWVREEFVWGQIEPEKDNLNWDFYDNAFNSLSKSNVKVLGIIDYSAPWATSNPGLDQADKYMPDLAQWEKYVSRVVERYGERVDAWQIWNEPNIPTFFKPQPNIDQYISILRTASSVVREKDPNAQILVAGMSGVDVGYLEIMKSKGTEELFDVVAVHPYQVFRSIPEDGAYLRDLSHAQQLGDLYNKPVWITEIGWPTDRQVGVDEKTQAQYLVRSQLLAYKFPRIEKVFWYDLRNDGTDPMDRENNFGLIRADFTPKLAFTAYKSLISVLSGATFVRDQSDPSNRSYDLVYKKGSEFIRVIWKSTNDGVAEISGDNDISIVSMTGEKSLLRQSKDNRYIALSNSPLYLFSKNEILDADTRGDRYDYEFIDQSAHISAIQGGSYPVWVTLRNTGNTIWSKDGSGPHVMLGTCRNIDRHSSFHTAGKWIGANRPAEPEQDMVLPGGMATFRFDLDTKMVSSGEYREYFCPLVESVTWMKDVGIYWDINIR